MRSRPRHLIFDLDGTLADSSSGILWSFHATLDALGQTADEATLRGLIGPPLAESFRTLGIEENRIDEVVALYRDFYAAGGVQRARLYDGITTTLVALSSEGVRLAVATAKRVDFARQMLDTLGIGHFFDEVSGASLDLRVTSKYDIMDRVLVGWASPPRPDVWMVGDRHFDMVAARAHGVRAVGALWGFGSVEELRAAGADWFLEHPGELVAERVDAGSPVCMLDEVCDVCGRIIDGAHAALCVGANDVRDGASLG